MKKRLLIVGAGGMGREVLAWAEDIVDSGADWYVGGFLDRNGTALESYDIDLPILGTPDTFQPLANDVFTCAIGDPKTKLDVSRSLQTRGAEFINLIHSSVIIGSRVQLGSGMIACPHVCITCDVRLGDFVFLNVNTTIGHDAILEDGCTLSGHCDVTGHARLGKGVFMGSHSCIHPGIKVEDYARVGAGSAVMRTVPSGATVLGVPAKKLPDFP